MPTNEAIRAQSIAELRKRVQELMALDIETASKRLAEPAPQSEWKEADVLALLLRIKALFEPLSALPLGLSTQQVLESVHRSVKEAAAPINKVLTQNSNEVAATGQQTLSELREGYKVWFTQVSTILGCEALMSQSAELTKLVANLQEERDKYVAYFSRTTAESSNEVLELRTRASSEMDKLKKEGEEILTTLRMTAAEVVAAKQDAHFQKEAKKHEDNALKCGVLVLLLGFAAGYYALTFLPEPTVAGLSGKDSLLNPKFVSRVFIISLLSSLVVWAARLYSAESHNGVINRHRSNALGCFQALMTATKDPHVKDLLLVEAAKAIFAPQSSGYSSKGQEVSPLQVTEVFRPMGSTEQK
jgi:hypothetical protein